MSLKNIPSEMKSIVNSSPDSHKYNEPTIQEVFKIYEMNKEQINDQDNQKIDSPL
jgi:hypothetical protein